MASYKITVDLSCLGKIWLLFFVCFMQKTKKQKKSKYKIYILGSFLRSSAVELNKEAVVAPQSYHKFQSFFFLFCLKTFNVCEFCVDFVLPKYGIPRKVTRVENKKLTRFCCLLCVGVNRCGVLTTSTAYCSLLCNAERAVCFVFVVVAAGARSRGDDPGDSGDGNV